MARGYRQGKKAVNLRQTILLRLAQGEGSRLLEVPTYCHYTFYLTQSWVPNKLVSETSTIATDESSIKKMAVETLMV